MEQPQTVAPHGTDALRELPLDERCARLRALVESCPDDDAGAFASWLSRLGARLWCLDGHSASPVHFARMSDHHARIEHRIHARRAFVVKQGAAAIAYARARHLRDTGLARAIVLAAQRQAEEAFEEAEAARLVYEASAIAMRESPLVSGGEQPKRRGRPPKREA